MAKRSTKSGKHQVEEEETAVEEPKEAPPEPVKTEEVKKAKAPVKPKPEKDPVIEIDRYFNYKGIPAEHRKAMRSFTTTKKATVKQWDEIFKRY